MLKRIHVKNFRSIVDTAVDFDYGCKRAPNGFRQLRCRPFMEDAETGFRGVPCEALFGSNAAGKSNVLKALGVLWRLISNPLCNVRRSVDKNLIIPCEGGVFFEVEFCTEGCGYVYSLEFDKTGILYECLKADGVLVFAYEKGEISADRVATGDYSKARVEAIISSECCDEKDRSLIRPVLNRLGRGYQGLNKQITSAYQYLQDKVMVLEDFDIQRVFPFAVDYLTEAAGIHQDEAIRRIVSVVRKLDVDVLNIELSEKEVDREDHPGYDFVRHSRATDDVGIIIRSLHRNVNGENVFFRFMQQESEGTKRLATIVGFMLGTIVKGGVLCIDEFDWALHPRVVQEMLSLFKVADYNPKNAQLIFTTHMTDLLDDNILRISEVCFVQRNNKVGTKCRRLVDMRENDDDIRNVTNFRKQYLEGRYYAIPHPAL